MHGTADTTERPAFPDGGGEMGALVRAHDWSKSPLGRTATWPPSLKTLVGVMLDANQPMFVAWGPERILLYNDAYAEILGFKHPAALGHDVLEVWHEIRADLVPIVEEAYAGRSVHMDDIELVLERRGYKEETHFAFSYTPVKREDGQVAGFFCPCVEITEGVFAERRQSFRLALEERLRDRHHPREVIGAAVEALGRHLRVSRAGYGEVQADGETIVFETAYAEGVSPLVGTFSIDNFGSGNVADLRRGLTTAYADLSADPRTAGVGVPLLDARAAMAVPLLREGRLRAVLHLDHREARAWRPDEVALVEEVAMRTWDALERARAEAELRASQARASSVLNGMGEGFSLLSREFRIVDVNAEAMRMETRPRESIVGRSHWEAYPGTETSELGRLYKKAIAENVPVSLEHRYTWEDGHAAWLEMRAYPVPDGLAIFYRDISERKRVEAAVEESEARFRNMADNAPVMMWVTDPTGSCTYLNRRWYEFTGQAVGTGEGYGWLDAVHTGDRPAAKRAFLEANAKQRDYRVEFRLRRADGAYRWTIDAAAARFDADGTYLGYVGSVIDIDEIRETELALRASNARAEALSAEQAAILGQLAEGVIVTDPAGRITFVNDAAARIHGVSHLDVEPDAYSETYRLLTVEGEPYPPRDLPLTRAVRDGETVTDARWRVRRPDGSEILAVGSARPVVNADGARIGAVLTARDDTERAQAEAALRASEGRLRFLDHLGAATSALADADAVLAETTRLVGEHLGVSICAYADMDEDQDGFTIRGDWAAPGSASIVGRYRLADFGTLAVEKLSAGLPLVINDNLKEIAPEEAATFQAIGISATICMPLVKAGRLAALMAIHDKHPRAWTEEELSLLREVTSRSWAHVERVGAAAELRASEEFTRRVLASSPDCIKVLSLDGHLETMSEGGLGVMEVDDFEVIRGAYWPDFWTGEEHPKALAAVEEAKRGGRGRFQGFATTMKGTPRWWDVAVTPILGPDGQPEKLLSVSRDVTATKEAEAALRASEARLKAVFDTVPVGIVLAEAPSGRITGGNAQAERIFGHPILPSASIEAYREWVSHHADGRPVQPDEYPGAHVIRDGADRSELEVLYHRGDGRDAWVRLIAAPIRDGDGRLTGGVIASLDIDREKRAERALRELNDTLEAQVAVRTAERNQIWALSRDLMLRCGFDGRITAVNPAWTEVLGWREDELMGRSLFELIHPDDLRFTEEAAQAHADGRSYERFDNRYRHSDGSYRWLSWSTRADTDAIFAVGRDVTADRQRQAELELAQEALRQSQKMEAVGQLTGGIAHDFNNMLAVVIGSLDLLGRRIDPADPRAKRYVDAATDGARRAALLTQRLLAFSRQQPLRPEAVDANKLVADMSELLRHSLGGAIQLETVLAGGLWRTHADPNQLENALLNLAVNARDAMPDGGRLTIETQNAHLDSRYGTGHPGVAPGQYVLIAVTDTGMGMSEEVVAKAFDPFFTTKEVGKGTGLGLSQVYGFVKQTGGHVKIYSEPGHGTTFKVYLPRHVGASSDAEDDTKTVEMPLGEAQEVVLVVEDEPAVRQFSVDALSELGYRVLEADGAAAALRLLGAHPEITLMFTDVVMPEVNGAKLAQEARARRPDLRILFTTGYTRNAVVHNGVLDPGVELIGKPFTIEELAAKVRAVLDAPLGPASD